jgi:predicted site-specific integrase-resolvase
MGRLKKQQANNLEKLNKVKIGYARVSSLDDRQKLGFEVQKEALKSCNIIFSEKQSGDNDNRPELANAIELAKQLSLSDKSVTLQIYKLDSVFFSHKTPPTFSELSNNNITRELPNIYTRKLAILNLSARTSLASST